MHKALFLDRDGVVNVDVAYAFKPEQITFVDGIFELCKKAKQQDYLIILVTNQSGIARGFYSDQDFQHLSDWMQAQFKTHGSHFDGIFYCPHHPDITGHCTCRKPETGLFLQAFEQFDIDKAASIMIGDKQSDMLAAHKAGIKTRLLFSPTQHSIEASAHIDSLAQAQTYLL